MRLFGILAIAMFALQASSQVLEAPNFDRYGYLPEGVSSFHDWFGVSGVSADRALSSGPTLDAEVGTTYSFDGGALWQTPGFPDEEFLESVGTVLPHFGMRYGIGPVALNLTYETGLFAYTRAPHGTVVVDLLLAGTNQGISVETREPRFKLKNDILTITATWTLQPSLALTGGVRCHEFRKSVENFPLLVYTYEKGLLDQPQFVLGVDFSVTPNVDGYALFESERGGISARPHAAYDGQEVLALPLPIAYPGRIGGGIRVMPIPWMTVGAELIHEYLMADRRSVPYYLAINDDIWNASAAATLLVRPAEFLECGARYSSYVSYDDLFLPPNLYGFSVTNGADKPWSLGGSLRGTFRNLDVTLQYRHSQVTYSNTGGGRLTRRANLLDATLGIRVF